MYFPKEQKCLLAVMLLSFFTPFAHSETDEDSTRIVRLSGNAFVTKDLDASIDFYTKFLGLEALRRFELPAISKAIYGVTGDEKIEYAALIPKGWPLDTPNLTGLNFAQVENAESSKVNQSEERQPFHGEFILTYEVRELAEIESEMKNAGVPIVTPLQSSATGKSITLTVLDPNGIRLHLYEYINK